MKVIDAESDIELVTATVAGNGSEIATVTEENFGIVAGAGPGIEFGVVSGTETDFGIGVGSVVTGTEVGIGIVAGIGVEVVPEAAVGTEIVAGIETGAEVELGPKERHSYYRVPASGFPDRSEKHKVGLVCREERVSDAYG